MRQKCRWSSKGDREGCNIPPDLPIVSDQSSVRLAGLCLAGIGRARIGFAGVRRAGIGSARSGLARICGAGVCSAGIGSTRRSSLGLLGFLGGLAWAARVVAARTGRARAARCISHCGSSSGRHRQATGNHQHLCEHLGIRHFASPWVDQLIRRDCEYAQSPSRNSVVEGRVTRRRLRPRALLSMPGRPAR